MPGDGDGAVHGQAAAPGGRSAWCSQAADAAGRGAIRSHAAADFVRRSASRRPDVKVTVTTKKGKPAHALVGKETTTGTPGRLACSGHAGQPGVRHLRPAWPKWSIRSALDFLDRQLLRFDAQSVDSFSRQRGPDVLELAKKDDAWRIVKPADLPADEKKVPELLKLLGDLKAGRVAAYQPKELKTYGLEKPEATVTVKLGGDKPGEQVLLIGAVVPDKAGERYAQVKGKPLVAVLPRDAVDRLLAGPLAYQRPPRWPGCPTPSRHQAGDGRAVKTQLSVASPKAPGK